MEQPVDNTKLNLNAFVNLTCQPNTAPFSHQLTLITLDETAPILSLFLSEPVASDSGRVLIAQPVQSIRLSFERSTDEIRVRSFIDFHDMIGLLLPIGQTDQIPKD
ncbi:hypothetical protein AHF37_09120 [Paragonimus kellicotti]|nr:hypothetical protein AHF37_09120 [Paragonimus kellicotti]